MTSNSEVINQDIRTDFEKMLEYVTGEPGYRILSYLPAYIWLIRSNSFL